MSSIVEYVAHGVTPEDERWLAMEPPAWGQHRVAAEIIGLAAAACVGFLTVRTRNSIGAVLVAFADGGIAWDPGGSTLNGATYLGRAPPLA